MSLPSVRLFLVRSITENHLEYFDDTSQLCTADHDDVWHTKMRALALILFELSSL